MRKLVVSMFLSLDGVMENPGWTMPYWNDEIAQFKADESVASDALLLGRVTYGGFAAAWPNSTDDGANQMNSIVKYVVTTTLDKLDWNNSTPIKTNIVDEITALKAQPGKNILLYGSGMLVHTLMQHDLIDEYRLIIYPLVVGSGKRLFLDFAAPVKLKLVESVPFSSGAVGLRYEPER